MHGDRCSKSPTGGIASDHDAAGVDSFGKERFPNGEAIVDGLGELVLWGQPVLNQQHSSAEHRSEMRPVGAIGQR